MIEDIRVHDLHDLAVDPTDRKKVFQAVCLFMLKDRYILGLRRAPGQSFAGQWEFPSTLVQAGETHAQAIARLVLGFGLEVVTRDMIYETSLVVFNKNINLRVYHVDFVSGRLKVPKHDTSAWFGSKALADVSWVAPSRTAVNLIQEALVGIEHDPTRTED